MQTFHPGFLGNATDRSGDEPFGDFLARRREHVIHVASLHHFAGAHDRHTIGDLLHDIHLVSDQHDGYAQFFVDTPEQGQHLHGGFGIQRTCRLIRKQNLRIGGQGPGDADTLFLASGQLRRILVRMLAEADEFKQLRDSSVLIILTPMIKLQRVGDVLCHRLGGKQVELLEDHADLLTNRPQLGLAECGYLGVKHGDGSRRRLLQGIDQSHQRRLAGTGIADDAEDVAFVDGQAYIVHRACDRSASA